MKRAMMAFCLIAAMFAIVLAAQNKPADYSGTWELDLSKSKLPQMGGGGGGGGGGRGGSPITSQTMTVKQDDKALSTETTTKREQGDSTQKASYNLDGSDTKGEVNMRGTTAPATFKAKVLEGGKLELTSVVQASTPMGEFTITTKNSWELADGGKTLKIHSVTETPQGSREADYVYTKK
jgi:hypothetical protein